MNVKKIRLGLIGKDVSKSRSETIHNFILKELGYECEYENISVGADDFDSAVRRLLGDFDGFNVTIPYKRDVMAYLDDVTGDALDYGAVNTVITATGEGYNTDGVGFMQMLQAAGISAMRKKVLVLGGGGSGRSTAVALKKAGATVYMYQRRREKLIETCEELSLLPAEQPKGGEYDILINCTGVGMHDTVGKSPVERTAFQGASAAIDLIYAPEKSEFLRLAEEEGLSILNGRAMLFYQAYFSDCLYLERAADAEEAERLYKKFTW